MFFEKEYFNIIHLHFLPIKSFCQNLDETVSYINALLKESTWQPSPKTYYGFNKINIDENGKIEIKGFLQNLLHEVEHKIEKLPFMTLAYQMGYNLIRELLVQ